jgi:hypothetical protein
MDDDARADQNSKTTTLLDKIAAVPADAASALGAIRQKAEEDIADIRAANKLKEDALADRLDEVKEAHDAALAQLDADAKEAAKMKADEAAEALKAENDAHAVRMAQVARSTQVLECIREYMLCCAHTA